MGRDDWDMGLTHRRTVRGGEAGRGEWFRPPELRRVDGPILASPRGKRPMFFVDAACVARRRTAQAQPGAQERLQCEEANDQRKSEPEGSGEEVAHAPASLDTRTLLLWTATERTVKVHQSRTSKMTVGPMALIAANLETVVARTCGEAPEAHLLYSLACCKPTGQWPGALYTEKGSVCAE
jgi:hypothetical protein